MKPQQPKTSLEHSMASICMDDILAADSDALLRRAGIAPHSWSVSTVDGSFCPASIQIQTKYLFNIFNNDFGYMIPSDLCNIIAEMVYQACSMHNLLEQLECMIGMHAGYTIFSQEKQMSNISDENAFELSFDAFEDSIINTNDNQTVMQRFKLSLERITNIWINYLALKRAMSSNSNIDETHEMLKQELLLLKRTNKITFKFEQGLKEFIKQFEDICDTCVVLNHDNNVCYFTIVVGADKMSRSLQVCMFEFSKYR